MQAAAGRAEDDTAGAAGLEAGRLLFARGCVFVKGVVNMADLPAADRPEIAFAGRSNVGKSSLINALAGRKALARTSNTPGRTRELNFFLCDGRLSLVDMPGYGYARVSKAQVKGWTRLIHDYLRGRPSLRRVYLLIDARHGPKPSDREIMTLMDEAAVSWQVVLTKADKPKAKALAAVLAATERTIARHGAAHPEVLVTSAQKGTGIAELRAAIAVLLEDAGG